VIAPNTSSKVTRRKDRAKYSYPDDAWASTDLVAPIDSDFSDEESSPFAANNLCCDLIASGQSVGKWEELFYILPDAVEFATIALAQGWFT
jgi:hypothetical protein